MKIKIILAALCLLSGLPALAQTNFTTTPLIAKTFTFTNKYKEVIHAEAVRFDSKEIVYKEVNGSGMGRVAITNLPTEFQLQFGYDAEKIRKAQEKDAEIEAETIRKTQEEQAKIKVEEEARLTREARLAKIARLRGPIRESTPKSKTPDAEISTFRDEGLIVSNLGTNAWETITIYVNSDPPFGYSCTIGPVKHLDSKVIPLREFTKKNGERFNPLANKVVKVWIGGGGYDYQSYSF